MPAGPDGEGKLGLPRVHSEASGSVLATRAKLPHFGGRRGPTGPPMHIFRAREIYRPIVAASYNHPQRPHKCDRISHGHGHVEGSSELYRPLRLLSPLPRPTAEISTWMSKRSPVRGTKLYRRRKPCCVYGIHPVLPRTGRFISGPSWRAAPSHSPLATAIRASEIKQI